MILKTYSIQWCLGIRCTGQGRAVSKRKIFKKATMLHWRSRKHKWRTCFMFFCFFWAILLGEPSRSSHVLLIVINSCLTLFLWNPKQHQINGVVFATNHFLCKKSSNSTSWVVSPRAYHPLLWGTGKVWVGWLGYSAMDVRGGITHDIQHHVFLPNIEQANIH